VSIAPSTKHLIIAPLIWWLTFCWVAAHYQTFHQWLYSWTFQIAP
jgi:hypothetical protein